MLSRISTVIVSLLKGSFLSHVEDEPTSTAATDELALPLAWFSEIPHCSLQCLYLPGLQRGCSHLDFDCICRTFEDVAQDEDVEACISLCPDNGDKRYAPGRILDFCELVGVYIKLPEYMNQYAALHRRARAGSSGSVSESQPSYTETGYYTTSISATSKTILESTTTLAETRATTAATTQSTTATKATATSGSSESSSGSSSSSSGLSTGAKAGIGVAVPLVVIIMVLGLWWYLRKRRGNKQVVAPGTGGNDLPEVTQSWQKKLVPAAHLAEADGNAISEVESNSVLPSMPHTTSSSDFVYELSANPSIRRPPPVKGVASGRQSSRTSFNVPLENVEAKITGASLQQPSESSQSKDQIARNPDAELLQLQTEMACIWEQRERLQQLKLLEEQEEELKQRIAALKASGSSV